MSGGWKRRLVFGVFALIGGTVAVHRPQPSPAAAVVTIATFPVVGPCAYTDTYGAPRSGGRQHEGVDIIAREGLPLAAVATGVISKVVYDRPGSLGGNYLRLTRADGTYFTYIHLSRFVPGLFAGQRVTAGQIVGFVGHTGAASGPHLHFEVHPFGGASINPTPVVNAAGGCNGRVTTPNPQPSSGGGRFDPPLTVFRPDAPLAANVVFAVQVVGFPGVPASSTKVDVTITLTGAGPGRAAVWPCGLSAGLAHGTPLAATQSGRATSTRVNLRPGDRGRICVVAETRVKAVVGLHSAA